MYFYHQCCAVTTHSLCNMESVWEAILKENKGLVVREREEKMTSLELCQLIEAFLDDKKAGQIIRLTLPSQSPLADYFLIASGTSTKHLLSLGETLSQLLRAKKIPNSYQTSGQSNWVIVDAGSVMLHLFLPEARGLYDLESLWGDQGKDLKLADEN